MPSSDASLPPAVAALVAGAMGARVESLAATVGGFSNLSRHARVGGRACVIKAADAPAGRDSLRHEAAVLRALRGGGVPAPDPLAIAEDSVWTVLVTEELVGRPGLALLEGDQAELPAAFAALGAILAVLHALPTPGLDGLGLAPRLSAAAGALDAPDIAAELRDPLAAALSHPAWGGRPRLLHGDAGLHNLLWCGGAADAAGCVPTATAALAGAACRAPTAYLLDWEWAAAGPPAFDLAWLRWTIGWRRLPGDLWEAALGAYGHAAPATELLDALALGQIAMILARVAQQPPARAEWLRRARWTLGR